jgi:hypothetical protein
MSEQVVFENQLTQVTILKEKKGRIPRYYHPGTGYPQYLTISPSVAKVRSFPDNMTASTETMLISLL